MISNYPGLSGFIFKIYYEIDGDDERYYAELSLKEMSDLVVSGKVPQMVKDNVDDVRARLQEVEESEAIVNMLPEEDW